MKHSFLLAILAFSMSGMGLAQQSGKPPAGQPPLSPAPPSALQTPHIYTVSPQDKARKNPVRFTDISVAHGKKLFATQCVMCHGDKADGKGDLAGQMKIAPPDFTKPNVLEKMTDGELFTVIGTGSNAMPGQDGRLTEFQRWEIVNFLRAVQGKTPEKATEEEKNQSEHILVIPH
jgi:mono/diheme cytochrome c family protein